MARSYGYVREKVLARVTGSDLKESLLIRNLI